MDGRDNEGAGQRRRPSRADSLRLTRMPQIPRTNPTGAYPTIAAKPSVTTEPEPVEDARPGEKAPNRRVGLIAAGIAVALAVPAGLIAAALPERGAAVAPVSTAPAAPAAGPVGNGEPAPSSSVPAGAVPSVSVSPSASAGESAAGAESAPVEAPTTEPVAVKTTTTGSSGKANPSGVNLALSAAVSASDYEEERWLPAYACDGDPLSRWSSGFTDAQWIKVDLRQRWQLSEIQLSWENAYAIAYRVETSADGRSWQRVFSTATGTGGKQVISLAGNVARYVRMTGVKRSNRYGYSLYEIEVR